MNHPTHPMITRSQSGIVKPIERLSLHTSFLSPIPKSLFITLKDPNWCNAMHDEYNALHKLHADGTLSRYKARLVANGSNQQHGVDFDETFSPIVKPATILFRTVYASAPGFVDSCYPNHVCLLQRSLYGLKQAPRAWFQQFAASSPVLLQQIVDSLHKEFDMTDLGALNYFLGISVVRHPTGLFLSQKKYARQLLERAHMVNCNPSRTPIDTDSKLGPDGVPVQDPTLYRSLAGGLQYLTFTRPDLSYAVQQVCLYMHDPREPHFAALKRIMRYVALPPQATAGYCVFLETAWIRNLLRELHSPLLTATCLNVITFVTGHVRVLHVPSRFQYADIFTKGLPSALFEDFRSSLGVRPPPALTAGAY
ncbi:ribonuclease H-like domain-containing protein [Tanacetum coccineum]